MVGCVLKFRERAFSHMTPDLPVPDTPPFRSASCGFDPLSLRTISSAERLPLGTKSVILSPKLIGLQHEQVRGHEHPEPTRSPIA